MAGIKDNVQVNVQGAILGVEEKGFSFVNEFKSMSIWKQRLILGIIIAIVPGYVLARVGVEQYLSMQYGRQALSAHGAFTASQNPVIGNMTIIRNPNDTYSAVVQVTNPNIELAATGIEYKAEFQNSAKETVSTVPGVLYLLPNEKKYLVFPKLENKSGPVTTGKLTLGDVHWQKKLNVPEVKLRAADPLLHDESNPFTFVAEGSVINESPYQVGSIQIVFLLYDASNKIIGVSYRTESRLLPFGRRDYVQQWPGIYRSQVSKIQILPYTNTLDPLNITIDPTNASNP